MKRLILLAALLWAGAACAQAYPSTGVCCLCASLSEQVDQVRGAISSRRQS